MKRKKYGVLAFLPLIVFLALYLGFGLFFYFKGESSPFNFVPREAALIFGIAFALLMGKEAFSKKTEDFMKNAATPGVMLQCFIFILAGIFSAVSKAMRGGPYCGRLCRAWRFRYDAGALCSSRRGHVRR